MERPLATWQQHLGAGGGLRKGPKGRAAVLRRLGLPLLLASMISVAAGAQDNATALTFAVALPEMEGPFTLGIFSADGSLVRLLYRDAAVESIPAGLNGLMVTWDGLDERGLPASPGTYRARGLVHGPLASRQPRTPAPVENAPLHPEKEGFSLSIPMNLPGGSWEPILRIPAAPDALYGTPPLVALSAKVLPGDTGGALLLANGLPLFNIRDADLPSGGIKDVSLQRGEAAGEVLVELRGERTVSRRILSGLNRIVPVEAGTLEMPPGLQLPSGAFLSGKENKDSEP